MPLPFSTFQFVTQRLVSIWSNYHWNVHKTLRVHVLLSFPHSINMIETSYNKPLALLATVANFRNRKRAKRLQKHTPDRCKETENADSGAHLIWDKILPFMSIRLSIDEAPTAKIWYIITNFKNKLEQHTELLCKIAQPRCKVTDWWSRICNSC